VVQREVRRLGPEAKARRVLDELAADDFAALPPDAEWLFCLCVLAEVAAMLGDDARAAVLHGLLSPYERLNALAAGEVALGSVARYLGILATTTRRYDEAARHFDDALELNARMGARPWLAHTQCDYALMLLERGEAGDDERARELLDSARTLSHELGSQALVARIPTA
jgi:tetratricopeptide (TPR) repeat protein